MSKLELNEAFDNLLKIGGKSHQAVRDFENLLREEIRNQYNTTKERGFDHLWNRYVDLVNIVSSIITDFDSYIEGSGEDRDS